LKPREPRSTTIVLTWRLPIQVNPHEEVGFALWRLGVYELVVSEVLWRLIDPGESVADIGANLGYMTSLMAERAGSRGEVTAFEPHPDVLKQLEYNLSFWRSRKRLAKIELFPVALSNSAGETELHIPAGFARNSGTAFLSRKTSLSRKSDPELGRDLELERGPELRTIPIRSMRLDAVFQSRPSPSVVKIDVEGAELAVLEGAGKLLNERKIRDLVFEDHGSFPTAATRLLEGCGYSLFKLQRTFLGPALSAPNLKQDGAGQWEPTNYLATTQPERAIQRLAKRGWRCLK
jgi:FkbM family methyltransferase